VNFRPLAPFGSHDCYISYPGWYGKFCGKFSENGPLLAPGGGGQRLRCENELSRVRVLVQLHRKFTEETANECASALRHWFIAIGSKGVFDEAGMTSLSPVLRYQVKDATFDVDASQSGAHTLITLVLAIMTWAMECRRRPHPHHRPAGRQLGRTPCRSRTPRVRRRPQSHRLRPLRQSSARLTSTRSWRVRRMAAFPLPTVLTALNSPPVIISTPSTNPISVGDSYVYQVVATDRRLVNLQCRHRRGRNGHRCQHRPLHVDANCE
jgi:hypothetical protein